jgi:hypothetical protein
MCSKQFGWFCLTLEYVLDVIWEPPVWRVQLYLAHFSLIQQFIAIFSFLMKQKGLAAPRETPSGTSLYPSGRFRIKKALLLRYCAYNGR